MTASLRRGAVVLAAVLAIAAIALSPLGADTASGATKPLKGYTVVIDPGHQLGNKNFPSKVNALVSAGNGQKKACNTTGAATNRSVTGTAVPEATINWKIATQVKSLLQAKGATVIMTRTTNSNSHWGPCIDTRGKKGNGTADLLLSIHGDGAARTSHGFHLLIVGKGKPQYSRSLAFAKTMRATLEDAGFKRANYVANGVRASNSYGTLNWSKKPALIAELGNLRNRADAKRLVSASGQKRYAAALAKGVEEYLLGK